jgi:hypothetical protein
MAVSVFRSRKIDFQSRLADKHLVRHGTGMLRRACRTGPRAALTLHVEQDSLSFMALLRGLFWLVLFIVLAFSFVVLFEYGPRNFVRGFEKEFARVKTFVVKQTEKVEKPKKNR